MTTLDTRVRTDDGVATVVLVGEIDGGARGVLDSAYAEASAAGAELILLDFGEAAYINSTGIALIVGLLGRARAEGIAVAACRLSDHYREIFEITRLSDFMSIHADEQRARAAAQGGTP